MGLFSFLTGTRLAFDADAAAARVQALEEMLPVGAQVELMDLEDGRLPTYWVQLVGDRSQASALLASIVEVVSTTERWEVSLEVLDAADASSSFTLPHAERRLLGVVARAHDELLASVPRQTISLDAEQASLTVSDVPRGSGVDAARAAARAWEGILRATDETWRDWSVAVRVGIGLGADGEHAEISYGTTVERDPDPTGRRAGPTGVAHVSDAEWAQRVLAAWDDTIPVLAALLRLPVPADHEAEISFTGDSLKPRLHVWHHETAESDTTAAKALVAEIRAQVPGTELKAR